MAKAFIQKVLTVVPTLLGASLIAFFLIRWVPGDPVTLLLGERGADPAVVEELNQKLGLHHPLPVQYMSFMNRALVGDLGVSIASKRPVSEEFWDRFPATLELSLVALLWSTIIAVPVGILAAKNRGGVADFLTSGISLVGYSMPIFWWGLVLIIIFSVSLGWFPVSVHTGGSLNASEKISIGLFGASHPESAATTAKKSTIAPPTLKLVDILIASSVVDPPTYK